MSVPRLIVKPFCETCDRDLSMVPPGTYEHVFPHLVVTEEADVQMVFNVAIKTDICGCCDDDEGEAA